MAFAFVAAGHYNNASSAAAVVPKPAGTVADDLMWAFLKSVNGAPTSAPSGWVYVADTDEAGSGSNFSLYYKVAGGSEPADYTWNFAVAGRLGGTIPTYRDGFNISTPLDVFSDTAYTVSNTISRAAGMTVTAPNSPLIFFGGTHSSAEDTFTPPTNPTAFAEDVDAGAGTGGTSRFSREIASVVWTGSGATGNMDATINVTTTTKHAFAVALNPSVGGGGGAAARRQLSLAGRQTRGREGSKVFRDFVRTPGGLLVPAWST